MFTFVMSASEITNDQEFRTGSLFTKGGYKSYLCENECTDQRNAELQKRRDSTEMYTFSINVGNDLSTTKSLAL